MVAVEPYRLFLLKLIAQQVDCRPVSLIFLSRSGECGAGYVQQLRWSGTAEPPIRVDRRVDQGLLKILSFFDC
jgi:hypothetical protein